MTVLQSTFGLPPGKVSSQKGAVAATAWAILSAKFSGTENVILNQALGVQDQDNTSSPVVVTITHGSNLNNITTQIASSAHLQRGTKVWNIELHIPADYPAGRASSTTHLLIMEVGSPRWTWKDLELRHADTDLFLVISPSDGGVDAELFTQSKFISPGQSKRLFDQFSHIFKHLLQSSASAVLEDLAFISPQDVADIESWNAKPVEPALDCVHLTIERRTQENPEAEAVCAWDGTLTYSELSRASDELAGQLIELGVGPEVFVPFLFEKSVMAIVVMVGVLKAGGGCVPLDPKHPRSRHEAILKDTSAFVVLSSETYQDIAQDLDHGKVLVINQNTLLASAIERQPGRRLPNVSVRPENPAFAVFTSGSTGQPKGIIIEHGAMCTSVRDHGRVMRFGKETRTIQFAAYTFDDSFSDIFTTLMFGGCICVPSEHDRLNDLEGAITRMGANHACLTVTVANQLRPLEVPSLKTMIVGGESVTSQVLQRWAQHVYLINSYGPAEASIFCSANSGLSATDDPINIGVGVGCLLHITDVENHDKLLPIGAVGELLIEGPILARCYIKNESKTKASFITDPTWAPRAKGAVRRFYKTGDLARYTENGTIQVLGRKDTQVKIHGQRIELGDIENHVGRTIKNCREVAVETVKLDTASTNAAPVLVAFLVLDGDTAMNDHEPSKPGPKTVEVIAGLPDGAEQLEELLPPYMIPSVYIKLQHMPLMVSGKLDRKALRAIASSLTKEELRGPETELCGLPSPETPQERAIQALWSKVLDVDDSLIKLGSSFFRLGGDSVAAMRLATAARDAGLAITVQHVFRFPTLQEQSANLDVTDTSGIAQSSAIEKFSLLGDNSEHIRDTDFLATRLTDWDIDEEIVLDVYPCSPLQSGVMALSAKNPGSYVAQMSYELSSEVDFDRLKDAWDLVFQSNDILRTRIIQDENDSTLWQVVTSGRIHWSEACDGIDLHLAKDKLQPMILGSKLARFALVSAKPESLRRWLVLSFHHAIFDENSHLLLLRSVERAYHNLPPSPHLDYNAFISFISKRDADVSADFWKRELANPPPPSFPVLSEANYLPSADQTISRHFAYEFPKGADVTPSTFLRAAWAILLAQYSESSDVVFGCTVNGRGIALDNAEMISGPTFATVPLRVTVNRDGTVQNFLNSLHRQYVDMIPHEQAGLQNIAQWNPESRTALNFQSLLVVQASDQASGGDSLLGSPEALGVTGGFFTNVLTIECRPAPETLNVHIHFDPHVLQRIQVERLSQQYEQVLRQLSSPSDTIGSLDLLGQDDIQTLSQWNSHSSEELPEGVVHQGYYKHLQLNPASPAVEDYESSLSYAELEALSNQLAQALVTQLGLRTGEFIPLCADKSVLIVVAALAILKAGRAIVLLDPSLPVPRLKYMAEKSKASCILYSASMAHLEEEIPVSAIVLNDSFLTSLPPSDHIQVDVASSDPACMVFSSGTTGQPKGSVLSHRAMSTGLNALSQFAGMDQLKPLRTLQFAGLSFDVCFAEILATLSVGGCVCVVPDNERTNEGTVRAINRFRANWAILVPTFASLLDTTSIPSLRTLAFIGESPPPSLFLHYPSHVQLVHTYGPSETTPVTFGTMHLDPNVPSNVGRPIIESISGWIVDPLDHNRLAPIGALGELLIAGPTVGDGYFGDPERTARAFVKPPTWTSYFQSINGLQKRHMYLTGDLFRYDADGNLLFGGRKDTQAKLHGQRMELGEVEHHLRLLIPEAKAVVAEVIKPVGQGRKVLAAFLCVPSSASYPETEYEESALLPASTLSSLELPTVVARAATTLPHFMVPNVFIPVKQIPFMRVSRKIDRRALQAIGAALDTGTLHSYTVHDQDKKPPQLAEEFRIRSMVSQVLKIEEESIGMNDSFLLLGGNSIDAMRLVSLAGRNDLPLTVRQIFKHPILEQLAQVSIRKAHQEKSSTDNIESWELLQEKSSTTSIPIVALAQDQVAIGTEIEDAYPCTALQEGMFALSLASPGTYTGQHVFAASPSIDPDTLMDAWRLLFESLGVFRTRIIQLPSSTLAQIVTRDQFEFSIEDNLETYLARDKSAHFGLGDKLNRFALIRPTENLPITVVWTSHHSVYDGFSIGLITTALEDALASRWDSAAARRADFRQYIKYVGQRNTSATRRYWEAQFANASFEDFPPTSSDQKYRSERQVAKTTVPFTQHSPSTVTASSIIRAAWALTISQYTGTNDVVFGATVSGRDTSVPNASEIIGPVLSTVPVRVPIEYSGRVRKFVETIQNQAIEMIRYQHFGLQNISRTSSEATTACQLQTLLVVQPSTFGQASGLISHRFADADKAAQYHTIPLVLDCDVAAEVIDIRALYDDGRVDPDQMQRILSLFSGFIQHIAQASPEATVAEIRGLNQPDLDTLHDWNATVPLAVEKCIHEVIPLNTLASRLAVRSWDGDLTYGELDSISTELAHHLVSLGVGPEILVPLCFQKSLWAMVTVFAVLKAGGAPIFLNSELSLDRLSQLIDFLDAKLLLSSTNSFLSGRPKVNTIVEVGQNLIDTISSSAPLPKVHPSNMAYASFTSGTTGTPKCIILEHRNVSTLMHLYTDVGEFRPEAKVLQFASYTFDATMKDFLATTLNGGTLFIPSEEDRMNNLVTYMRDHQITQATLTPTIGGVFGPAAVPSLEVLVLAGEKMTPGNLATWAPAVHLNNAYGPSETTGRSACQSGLRVDSDPSNIGHPIGCICWLVDPDDHTTLVPINAVGEIVIEGPTVSRGYFKDAAKTRAAFIPPPIWIPAERRQPHNLLYKTGDLARLNSDRSLTIIGRKDAQVKLRGQRIELEEVESQFRAQLPTDVGIVVEMVSSKTDSGANTLLAAFLHDKTVKRGSSTGLELLDPGSTKLLASLDIHHICAVVGRTLAPYMIPSVFLAISHIPLLPSAKTDRKRLRAVYARLNPDKLTRLSVLLAATVKSPANHRQERIQSIVAEVLRLDHSGVGMNHNFLQLGGDSITAIRLVSAARAEDIGLTVADILRSVDLEHLERTAIDLGASQEVVKAFELLGSDSLQGFVASIADQCHITANLVEDVYPCTPLQEALISLSIQQEGDYVARQTFHLPDDIDFTRLATAWDTITQVLPVLRTRIVDTADGLYQVIVKENSILSENATDLRQSPPALGEALNRLVLERERKTLTWISHHATYDGISTPLVLSLVDQAYHQEAVRPRSLSDFRLFVKYLRQLPLDASHSFWDAQLAETDASSFPPTPPSTKHRVDASARFQSKVTTLPGAVPSQAVIRASWALVLAAHTSSDDVVFGTILSGRNAPVHGIERMAGPTIATVPIRIRIQRDEHVGSFLSRVQHQAIEMIPHEHFGLQNIRRIGSEARHACDFNNLLVFHPAKEAQISFERHASIFRSDQSFLSFHMNTYPLVLEIQVSDNGFSVDVSYDESTLSESRIYHIIHQFEHIVSQLSGNSDHSPLQVREVEASSSLDQQQIYQWNQIVPPTSPEILHHLISQRAVLTPDAEAVSAWDGQLTYKEIDHLSSVLSNEITAQDSSVGSFVALCFEKSLWNTVAMLAVLKAGKAFAFLDPSYPLTRLQQVTSILRPVLAISSPESQDLCRQLVSKTIVLEPDTLRAAHGPIEPANIVVDPAHPMCAIFTSGTTGKPKGAILSHRSYVSANLEHTRTLKMDSTTRMLQFASCSFDAMVFEVMTTLMVGGCVCVPDEKYRNAEIGQEIDRLGVNWSLLTPSFTSLLSPERVPSLRNLVLVGEAANAHLISVWSDKLQLHNGYGPSECSIFSTLNIDIDEATFPMNIGRPSGCVTWIVHPDDIDRLVPLGAPGELLLEGPNIGEGYIDSPEQTKAVFLDRPPTWFPRENSKYSAKFYRTGDIVKYAEDGSIIFVGRKDNQTKIRGQRVELSDIENHLTSVSNLGHTAVLIPKSGALQKRLVAIFNLKDDGPRQKPAESLSLVPDSNPNTARSFISTAEKKLSAELPAHMVPSFWIPVSSLPFLPSGKLDRKRVSSWLDSIDDDAVAQILAIISIAEDGEEELTDREIALRDLWHQVLNVSSTDINSRSSFLQLGGDSISAMQLMSKAKSVGLQLRLQDIMRSKNLRELAQQSNLVVSRKVNGAHPAELEDHPFELSPIQRLYFEITPEGNSDFEQSMLLKITQSLKESVLADALEQVLAHHSQLRARYVKTSGVWRQMIPLHRPKQRVLQVHHTAADEIPRVVSSSKRRLDLENGPVFAAELINTGQGQYLFLIAHHLSVDLMSWRIILQDLEDLILGRAQSLTGSISFQSWTSLQLQYCQRLEPQKLAPDVHTFDAGYWGIGDGVDNKYSDATTKSFVMDRPLTSSILHESSSAFASKPVDIFLAAAISSFGRVFTDRDLPTVFLESHGREPWDSSIDILRTVGWFTTLFPVTVARQSAPDIVDAVRLVKDLRSRFSDNGFAAFACNQLLLSTSGPTRRSTPVAEITMNFLGHYQQLEREDALFREADIDLSSQEHSSQERFSLFNINVQVRDGRLHFDVSFHRQSLRQDLITKWVYEFERVLQEAASVLPKIPRTYTPGDFPLLRLPREDFEPLIEEQLPSLHIDVAEVDELFPCSPMQLQMLQDEENAVGHHVTRLNFEVKSTSNDEELDSNRLAKAFLSVVERHSILRTGFIYPNGGSNDGRILQVVLKRFLPGITHINVDGEFTSQQPQHTDAVYRKLRSGEPPYQLTFSHIPARNLVFVSLDISHALIDGASVKVLLRDWDLAYQGKLHGGAGPSFQALVQHIEFRASEHTIHYWSRHLSGLQPTLLPLQGNGIRREREQHFVKLDFPPMAALQEVCQRTSVTLANMFHAVWAITLCLMNGSDSNVQQVVFGYLTSGRDVPLEDIENAVGPYFNLHPSRYVIDAEKTLREVLQSVQDVMTERLPFQNFSWREIQDRVLGAGVFPFNTLINIHRFAPLEPEKQGRSLLDFKARPGYDPLAYDVELTGRIDTEVTLSIAYTSSSISDEFASRIATLLERIVDQILLDVDSSIVKDLK